MKPYPAYKDSGLPWFGYLPKHWNLSALSTLSKLSVDRNPGDLPLLSVFLDRGVIPYDQGGGQVHAPSMDLSNYQVVRPGDFVLNNQQAWRGSVGVSAHHGIISPAYIVLCLSAQLNPTYSNYLMRCAAMVHQFVVASKGVGDIQRQIYWPYLRRVQVPLPPIDEQRAIVAYLDRKNADIDRFITKKRQLIALLHEQKAAIINQAVTKGLNPDAPMKPSGVEWMGDIPLEWSLLPASTVLQEKKVRNTGFVSHTVLSLSYGQIVIKDIEVGGGLQPASFETYQMVEPGNIVLRLTDLQNDQRSLRVGLAKHSGIITSAYLCLSTKNGLLPGFVYLQLHAADSKKVLYGLGGGLRQSMGFSDLKRLPILLCPPAEQLNIVAHVESEISQVNNAISKIKREIELINEYRTTLISDAVTGKIDVRETRH